MRDNPRFCGSVKLCFDLVGGNEFRRIFNLNVGAQNVVEGMGFHFHGFTQGLIGTESILYAFLKVFDGLGRSKVSR